METDKFEDWAILELMGHRRLAGKVSECQIAGASFVRIDVPAEKEADISTQFYSPQAVYCITPTSEDIARSIASQARPEPVHRWEFPQLRQGNDDPEDLPF
jgi:hypothetical protein